MSFNDLSTELLQLIFGHCGDRADHLAISAVCHRWAEAVQRLLLRRTCFTMTFVTPSWSLGGRSGRTAPNKSILLETDRRYTSFRVEWGYRDADLYTQKLGELLDVCQERFSVQRLYLSAPPRRRLVRFFEDHQQWLLTLVELHVTFMSWSKKLSGCELSLPNLKQLTWSEPSSLTASDDDDGRRFVLTAPELCRLKIISVYVPNRVWDWKTRPLLSYLKLESCPKLENVAIEGIEEIHQRSADNFEPFLKKLKVLTVHNCDSHVAKQLYEKCANLKELTIRFGHQLEPEGPLQITPRLAANLENLTLVGTPYSGTLTLYGDAIFPKLRRLYVQELEFDINGCVSLTAPQLVSFTCLSSNHILLNVLQSKQIRTMRIELDNSSVTPPPTVTELHLRFHYTLPTIKIRHYLPNFPNLTRLTLNSEPYVSQIVYCKFFEHLPKLESFAAYQLTLRLVDCKKFASLKSLILSHCVIEAKAHDEHVRLTALEYVRIEQVTIDGARRDCFPIRVNERQPPIEVVRVTRLERNVFHSRNFKSTIRDELEPEFVG